MMRIILVYSEPELTFNQVRSTALLRLDSIMFGVLTSYIYYHGKVWRERLINASLGFSLLLIPVVIISMQPDKIMDESFILKVFLFPMASFAAVGLLVLGIDRKVNYFIYRLARPVSRWSYSAYLVNLLILSAMRFYLPKIAAHTAFIYWIGFIFTTLVLSAMTYNVFERNVLLWRDYWMK